MDTLVEHSESEKVGVGGGAQPLGVKKGPPNLKIVSSPSKSIPKKPSAVEPEDVDIEDLVHKTENLKKEEALARVAQLEDAHEMTYFRMGGVLSVINKNKWFDPYDSFDEWVENKTAMKRAKAMALIQIYDAIANSGITRGAGQAHSLDQAAGDRPVLTKDNVLDWVEESFGSHQDRTREAREGALGGLGRLGGSVSTAKYAKSFKFHDDQNETVEAALDKAKKVSGTPHDSVAFEHICLDYMGGQTMAQRLQAVGPDSGAKAVAEAYVGEALNAFIKAFGVMKLLHAIDAAAPHLNIEVLEDTRVGS